MRIYSDYPGGNIKVNKITDDMIDLEQDSGDSNETWFYWNFCVKPDQKREVIFKFNSEVVGPFGPAISRGRLKWSWLGRESLIDRTSFRYKFDDLKEVYFCFSLPYQLSHFENFYTRFKDHPMLKREVLAVSEQGRFIPILQLGNEKAAKHIIVTCRHHACECTASYVLEGMLTYFLENDKSNLMNHYLVHAVPFVDIDGIEKGEQGKTRTPYDHNRDYNDKPIYKSTISIKEYVSAYSIIAGIDLHSPWKWGGINDNPFFVRKESPMDDEVHLLGSCLQLINNGKNVTSRDRICYKQEFDLRRGQAWNNGNISNTFTSFLSLCGAKLSCTFEMPFFGDQVPFTQDNCIDFGRDFAQALECYVVTRE